ncbi:MAG TPA: hypothetical protein VFZ47_06060 [Chitinophagaceae bacterium]
MRSTSTSTYCIKQTVSCLIMVLSLAWLTVSIPFVYASQQEIAAEIKGEFTGAIDDESNPFSNTTEEKTESGGNTLSEYLHDIHSQVLLTTPIVKYSKCHPSDLYYAFHPELISPPPEFARS